MQRISVKDQVEAVARAKAGVDNLAAHPKTTRGRLGAARDQLNITCTWSDPAAVWDAVAAIEGQRPGVLRTREPATGPRPVATPQRPSRQPEHHQPTGEITMANDTVITIIGNLTDDPELRFTPSGATVANFTVASTPRTFNK